MDVRRSIFAESHNMEAESFKKLKHEGLKHVTLKAIRLTSHNTTNRAMLNLCSL